MAVSWARPFQRQESTSTLSYVDSLRLRRMAPTRLSLPTRVAPSPTVTTSPPAPEQSPRVAPAPLLFRVVTKFPKISLLVCLLVQLCVWATTGGLLASGYDILPLNFEDFPIQIDGDKWFERALAVTIASADWPTVLMSSTRQSKNFLNRVRIDLLYTSDGDNILTQESLVLIKKFETELRALPDFDRYYIMPFSLMNSIPAGVAPDNRAVATILTMASENATLANLIDFVLPKNRLLHKELQFVESPTLRTVFFPRSWTAYASDGFTVFQNKHLRPLLNRYASPGQLGPGVKFSYWSLLLFQTEGSELGKSDALLAIGSLIFIVLVIFTHTRSFALTGAAVFGILTSLAGANLIYRVALDRRFIGVFHAVSVFVLLGIGADDVFVLFDAWRDSFAVDYPTQGHKLAAVFRRAAGSMLITSLTSAIAFLVNALCRVPLVATFGIFTSLSVVVNYVMIITFLPCVLINLQAFEEWRTKRGARCSFCPASKTSGHSSQAKRKMAVFFHNYFFPLMKRRTVAVLSLVVSLLISVISIWQATQLGPSRSMLTQMFRRGTNFDRASRIIASMNQDAPAEVAIIFGLDVRDRSECHQDSYLCKGKYQTGGGLDLNPWESQRAILKLCRELRWDLDLGKRLKIRQEEVTLRSGAKVTANAVQCFAADMEDDAQWLLKNGSRSVGPGRCDSAGDAIDLSVPITQGTVESLMRCRPDLYGPESVRKRLNFSRTFDRYYESAVVFWVKYVVRPRTDDEALDIIPMAMADPVKENSDSFPDYGKNFGGQSLLLQINIKTKLTVNSGTFFTGIPVRDAWEEFTTSRLAKMPPGLRQGFQCTAEQSVQTPISLWEWYEIQRELWANARNGILIGLLAVTLPILLFATRANLLLAGVGVLCLGCTTVSVMALVNAVGWPLGVCESISLALVTGLSVDYLVHFIEAYHMSTEKSREDRVREMLTRVGGAVTSGAITTIGATVFVFFARLIIFIQFGTALCASIGFAFFYALFLLTPLLMLLGPEGNFGSMFALGRRLFGNKTKDEGKEDEEVEREKKKKTRRRKEGGNESASHVTATEEMNREDGSGRSDGNSNCESVASVVEERPVTRGKEAEEAVDVVKEEEIEEEEEEEEGEQKEAETEGEEEGKELEKEDEGGEGVETQQEVPACDQIRGQSPNEEEGHAVTMEVPIDVLSSRQGSVIEMEDMSVEV